MKRTVSVKNQSFDEAGLPKDWKDAMCELIWNGFDAKATIVSIDYEADAIGHLSSLIIEDNGVGIDFETLNDTFGGFLASLKKPRKRTSYLHGKKGRGRFSFNVFSPKATWETRYKGKDGVYQYAIIIDAKQMVNFEDSERKKMEKEETGTKVIMNDFNLISGGDLSSDEFLTHLKRQFGWFLELNKERGLVIKLNGENLRYEDIISNSDKTSFTTSGKSGSKTFSIHFIQWNEKTKEKFYYYFLDDEQNEKGKQLTSFNNGGDDFYHSVYVESDFFDQFCLSDSAEQMSALELNQSDANFKELIEYLKKFLEEKRKIHVRKNSEILIQRFETKGIMPKFADNEFAKTKESELKEVLKEVYAVEPRIFNKLGDQPAKTIVGLMNLVLDTDERENVITILDGIVELSPEQRSELASTLKRTKFSFILRTIKMIEQRYKNVEQLRSLVFDLRKFANEREHVQKAMEECFWLFGEQYHLVTADETFEQALSEYLYIVDGRAGEKELYKIDHPERLRRPDIFLCRQRNIDDPYSSEQLEENIIAELKEPEHLLNKDLYRQIEDYMEFIIAEPRFNSGLRRWKFYMVGKRADDFVKGLYEANSKSGKKFLVKQTGNYEIYAVTWDDVFKGFELRHKFLYDKLQFNKTALQEEMNLKGIVLSKESAAALVDEIRTSSAK